MKISPRRLASSRHLVSVPLRRTPSASDSRPFRVSISSFQLGDGAGRGRLIEDLLLGGLDLVVRCLFQILDILGVERRKGGCEDRRSLAAALEHLQLAQPAFQPLPAAAQRLVDRFGRGGEPPLQDGEREADGAGPLVVFERLGAVELLAHVVGDRLVELGLGLRELVGHGVGDALGEERRAVELEQALLHHPAHQVRDIGHVDPVAEAALETVAVEQRHEELEVLLLAVVRRRRHQQEVPREGREKLAEPVALGVLGLAAEDRGRHLVRLVADDEIPAAIRRLELLLHVLVARELVETGDDQVGLQEPVAGARGFELVVGENLEGQMEAAVELVLPLLGEAARADDEAALQVAAGDQLLDQQARHDRLAGARVVGEQEAQRLPRQHGLVDRRDLVRQRLDDRGVDRQHRVEQVRQADALGLGDQPEQARRRRRSSRAGPARRPPAAARRGDRAVRWPPCRRASCRSVRGPRSRTTAR